MAHEYEWDEIEIVVKEDYLKLKRKAKAFDEISKYVNQKLSVEVPLDDDYLIGRFQSYETIQEFMEGD